MNMRPRSSLRILLLLGGAFLLLSVCGVTGLRLMFSRTREFRAQAEAGQPIVRAIEEFRRHTGTYPASLADLVPKYLPTVPDLPNEPEHKFSGWDYQAVTNGTVVSYTLKYYMGKGCVEYRPPNWIGNDEGTRTILLKNK